MITFFTMLIISQIFTDIASRNQQNGNYSSRPFQNLMVLVRDWNFQSSHAFGVASDEFMAKYGLCLPGQQIQTPPNSKIMDAAKCYRMITGFLLPHPGARITDLNESLNGQQSSVNGNSIENTSVPVFDCDDLFQIIRRRKKDSSKK